jgi:hypothetical protein
VVTDLVLTDSPVKSTTTPTSGGYVNPVTKGTNVLVAGQ